MLPFEKTFRTEDTNSLKMCKDKCIQAGEKCQSISFGLVTNNLQLISFADCLIFSIFFFIFHSVHRRGNGTCQLSTESYGTSGGRPSGIIFDPDFDLYARKTNCFDLSDNTIPMQDGMSGGGGGIGNTDGYGGLSPNPTLQLPNRPSDDPPVLVVNPSPTTTTTLDNRPPPPPPPTNIYGGVQSTPLFIPKGPGTTLGPSTSDGDHLYFSHDVYPLYKYPMLYEPNYPAPNDDLYIPGGYASNVPEVEDRYRPSYSMDDNMRPTPHAPPRPIFGLGYGNGYSYGQPEHYNPTTSRPNDQMGPVFSSLPPDRRPPLGDRPNYTQRPGSYPSDRPDHPIGPSRPGYDQTTPTYYPLPEYGASTLNRPTHDVSPPIGSTAMGNRPSDSVDYMNRPDPPQGGSSSRPPMRDREPGYAGSTQPNDYDYVRRNGTASRPDGLNYNDDKTISTYFNPEDYMSGSHKSK